MGRVFRYARTFRQITYALQSSTATLFWAMVIVFMVIYCFAVVFCQASTYHLRELADDGKVDSLEPWYASELRANYDSVLRSIYSLFISMMQGRSWYELLRPLMQVSGIYTCLFLAFISISLFGVLNIVTAIFVDSALQSQQHHKDLLIQENVIKKQLYRQHLEDVFKEIDQDGSGSIMYDEVEFFLSDPDLNLYLESIDIYPNDARALFTMLDLHVRQ